MATSKQRKRKASNRAHHNKANTTKLITDGVLSGTKVKTGPGYHDYEMPSLAWAHTVRNGMPEDHRPKGNDQFVRITNSDKNAHAGSINIGQPSRKKYGWMKPPADITPGREAYHKDELAPGVPPGVHPELGLAKANSGKGKRDFALRMAQNHYGLHLTTEHPDGTITTMTPEEIANETD